MNEKDIELLLERPTLKKLDDIARNEIRTALKNVPDTEIDIENHRECAERILNEGAGNTYSEVVSPIVQRYLKRNAAALEIKRNESRKKKNKWNLILFFVILPILVILLLIIQKS